MIYLYQCDKCKHEQEIEHKVNDKNVKPCEKCNADPAFLKRLINFAPAHGKHVSWSKWRVS